MKKTQHVEIYGNPTRKIFIFISYHQHSYSVSYTNPPNVLLLRLTFPMDYIAYYSIRISLQILTALEVLVMIGVNVVHGSHS